MKLRRACRLRGCVCSDKAREGNRAGGVGSGTSCHQEESCLSQNQLPFLAVGCCHVGKWAPHFQTVAFSQAENTHFNGKFSDFYSLRFSGLNLILSSNNCGAYSVTNSLKGTVASHFFSLLIYLCIVLIVYC